MRKQVLDCDLAVGDEAGTFCLNKSGERPRSDDGELLAQQVRADVEAHAAAFADKTRDTPCPSTAYRGQASLRRAGGVERQIGTQAVCQRLDRGDRIISLWIDQGIRAEIFGARKSLRADIKCDDTSTHCRGELRR